MSHLHLRDSNALHSTAPKPARSAPAPGAAGIRASSRSRSRSRSGSRSHSPSTPTGHNHGHGAGSASCGINGSGINPRAAQNKAAAGPLFDMSASTLAATAPLANGSDVRRRQGLGPAASTRSTKSPSPAPSSSSTSSAPRSPGRHDHNNAYEYDGLPTLEPIRDDETELQLDGTGTGIRTPTTRPAYDPDSAFLESPISEHVALPSSPRSTVGRASGAGGASKPPPPAPSAALGTEGRAIPRKRRTSSITRKPSPGATPKTVVDWEIPRKTLHSSIGFLTLWLWYLNPPTVTPLVTTLTAGLVGCTTADFLRFTFPTFREYWELYFGFLMRESERDKVNGVVWYLVGVIWVLVLYPRDIAVVAILTLSWSDTTASTIGRLWGRHTPPLPPHLPGVKAIKFAPRKSLAGFMAATFTGAAICLGFWHNGSNGRWAILEAREAGGGGAVGFLLTAVVVGAGGAVAEAMDLGLDDNLTLPILSGALIWAWLATTNLFF